MRFKARYIGPDGMARDLDAENAEAAARSVSGISMGSSKSDAKAILAQMMANRGARVGQKLGGKEETKVADGSAVTKRPDGSICLRGEEASPLVEGAKMYGSANGRKGYFTLADFDDKVDGGAVGEESTSLRPNAGTRSASDRGGWRIPISRTAMKVEPSLEMKCNKVTVYDLMSFLIMSENGRVVGKTKETKREVVSFFVLSDKQQEQQASNGKFCVRAFWADGGNEGSTADKPLLSILAFGKEEDLDTYDESSGKFRCNYVDGNIANDLVEDPPVKRVAVSPCSHGIRDRPE